MSNWCHDHSCGVEADHQRIGCEKWRKKHKKAFYQKYSGHFFSNCLHNRGIYQINDKAHKVYMDGLFYANRLEGYGQLIYQNGKTFEGLFKQHRRYGPGVATHPDGGQDVGLWNDFHLVRLSIVIGKNYVQTLGKTLQGKAILLKYRKLVPLYDEPVDYAREVMEKVGAKGDLLDNSSILYNYKVRNPKSIFFNRSEFDNAFFADDTDCTIEIIEGTEEKTVEKQDSCNSKESNSASSNVEASTPEIGEDITVENVKKCRNCTCPGASEDYITQICVQLAEIEQILEKLNAKKSKLEEELIIKLTEDSSSCDLNANADDLATKNISVHTSKMFESTDRSSTVSTTMEEQISTITLCFEVQPESISNFKQSDDLDSRKVNLIHINDTYEPEPDFQIQTNTTNHKIRKIFDEMSFYNTIKANLKRKLNRAFDTEPIGVANVKQVKISDLLAWNNEQRWIDILKHCFRHRKSQQHVHFNVTNILTGQRNFFNHPGIYESSCRKFLIDCFTGHDRDAFHLLRINDLNPDLCDAHGNTGLMLASVSDRINVINMLVGIGAKVDTCNDEGLTPLTMTILRHISLLLKVGNWEAAFLQAPQICQEDLLALKEWCPNNYLMRCKNPSFDEDATKPTKSATEADKTDKILHNTSKIDMKMYNSKIFLDADNDLVEGIAETLPQFEMSNLLLIPNNYFTTVKQEYVFRTEFVRVPKPVPIKETKTKKKKNKKEKKKGKKNKRSSWDRKSKSSSEKSIKSAKFKEEYCPIDQNVQLKFDDIVKTITTLLNYKADPNFGQVPMPAIFLATFTNEPIILEMLFEHGAHPNITLDDNSTCLHVLTSSHTILDEKKLKMLNILFKYKANPNLRTSPNHWVEVREEIINSTWKMDFDIKDNGKNALHLFCLREDLVSQYSEYHHGYVTSLIVNGCNPNDLYLGHSPLSFAVLRCNLNLIRTLLDISTVNVYEQLGCEMGNVFTLLFTRKCLQVWTLLERKTIIAIFMEYCFNPLVPIGNDFDNVVHFLEWEKANQVKVVDKTAKGKGNKKKDKKSDKSKKSKKSKKTKSMPKLNLDELEKYVVVETRRILLKNLQCQAVCHLYKFIMENLFEDPLILALANFVSVNEALKCTKLIFQFGLIELSSFSYAVVMDLLEFIALQNGEFFERKTMAPLLEEVSFLELKCPVMTHHPLPEVDCNLFIYEVCFNCLQRRNRILKKCPNCELVYFCSFRCNEAHNPWHKCNLVYYHHEEESPNRLPLLLELVNKCKTERMQVFVLRDLEQKIDEMKFQPVSLIRKVRSLTILVNKLKIEREQFIKTHSLLEYYKPESDKCPTEYSIETDEMSEQKMIKPFDRNNFTRQKSQFLSDETVLKKLKQVPKLNRHMPLSNGKIYEARYVEEETSVNTKNNMELLSKVFVDFNLPLMLLPYACYKDGQIYYTIQDNIHFRQSLQQINDSK